MHQFDLLYMPSDTLYGSKYKYILAGIVPQPLTKKQLKGRRNKNSKLNKKFKNLSKEINSLKSQIEVLEN